MIDTCFINFTPYIVGFIIRAKEEPVKLVVNNGKVCEILAQNLINIKYKIYVSCFTPKYFELILVFNLKMKRSVINKVVEWFKFNITFKSD